MEPLHIIPMDVHCKETAFCVMTAAGRVTRRGVCPTRIPELVEVIQSVRRPRYVVFEEGTLAEWLGRELKPHADQVVSCNPRRNALIAKESDKDDPIDAEKLGHLYRGGYVRPVHHSDSAARQRFKHHVALYHGRVRSRTREANHILAQFRRYGIFIQKKALAAVEHRPELLARLPRSSVLRADMKMLFESFDLGTRHILEMRRTLIKLARRYEQICRFVEVPGVRWIWAATFFAYLDTPWRFRSKFALWKYMGIGLQRMHSGEGPTRVGVPPSFLVARPLKNAILMAADSAIRKENSPFKECYWRWLHAGMEPRKARRSVARVLAAALWGMWKTGSAYRPEWVGMAAAVPCGRPG